MKFSKAPPNPYYDDWGYYSRLESETGVWTIALIPVLFGVRVMSGLTNAGGFELDVCCGNDSTKIAEILTIVTVWLEQFPESISPREVNRKFPYFEIKPVFKNPEWQDFVNDIKSDLVELPEVDQLQT